MSLIVRAVKNEDNIIKHMLKFNMMNQFWLSCLSSSKLLVKLFVKRVETLFLVALLFIHFIIPILNHFFLS